MKDNHHLVFERLWNTAVRIQTKFGGGSIQGQNYCKCGILQLFHCCSKEFILVDCCCHRGLGVESVAEIVRLRILEGIMIVHDWAIVIGKCKKLGRVWLLVQDTNSKQKGLRNNDCRG